MGQLPTSYFRLNWLLRFGLLLSVMVSPLAAQERELKSEASEKVDAVLVLDSSGSMLVTDPLRLREEGARLFLQFLKPGDRFAIIEFSRDAKLVKPLTEYRPDLSELIAKDIAAIGSSGLYTDLLSGVKSAKQLIDTDRRKDATPVIVLLSDGKMDPDPAVGSSVGLTSQLLNDYLPELKSKGVKVHTLSFSDQADKDLLSQIALGTEGSYWFTPSADKIHESFANLFLAVKKPQMLPLRGKGFKIDADVQEATFYINREDAADIEIQSPTHIKYTSETVDPSLKWFKGQKFDVITLIKPEVGDWQLMGLTSTDGFATLLTNLKLVTEWPGTVSSGVPALLQARLYEGEKPLALKEISGVTSYGIEVTPTDKISEPIIRAFLKDDGTDGDSISGDGIFSANVTLADAGEYRMRIRAKAPTFERQQQIAFRVKPPLIKLEIVTGTSNAHGAEGGHGKADSHASDHGAPSEHAKAEEHDAHAEAEKSEAHGEDGHGTPAGGKSEDQFFQITLSEEAVRLSKIEVKLIAIDRKRQRFTITPIKAGEEGVYEVPVKALPHDGQYSLQATFSAEAKNRKSVKAESEKLDFTKASATVQGGEIKVDADSTDIVIEHDQTHEEVPESDPFPLIPLIVVVGAGAGAGFFLLRTIKSGQGQSKTELPDVKTPQSILDGIAALEARLTLTEIQLDDPILKEDPASAAAAQPAPAAAPVAEANATTPGA